MFRDKIREMRVKSDITIAELSVTSGIPLNILEGIEEGSIFPDIGHLTKLSKAFGKHQGFFLQDIIYGSKN